MTTRTVHPSRMSSAGWRGRRHTIATVIKYLGSKRVLVPVLGDIASAAGATTAVDLFTGTTRVAQEFKRRGIAVTGAAIATLRPGTPCSAVG